MVGLIATRGRFETCPYVLRGVTEGWRAWERWIPVIAGRTIGVLPSRNLRSILELGKI